MRFVDEYRSNEKVQTLLEAIRKKVTRPWYIMEICGGQTHAIARYRLEEMLPPDLQLLHGPGCPVCRNTGRDNRLRLEVGDTAECDLSPLSGYDASSGK